MGVITRHDLLPEALEETFMGQQAPLGAGEQTIMQFCLSGWLLVARLVPPPWVP
jgi:hypothetical protein